jgi:hypothetical protein
MKGPELKIMDASPGGESTLEERPSFLVATPSVADRKALKTITAKKGFSKYISPRTEMIIGVFVLLMIISPAIFFSIAVAAPYYTVTPSNCMTTNGIWNGLLSNQINLVNNTAPGTGFGNTPNPIPPVVFYRNQPYNMMNLNDQLGWLLGEWTVYLDRGVCPNGQAKSWPKYCLPYTDDDNTPNIWKQMDIENQLQVLAGVKPPVVSDFQTSAIEFNKAYSLSVIGCIVSWVFIFFTIYDAVKTDFSNGDAITDADQEEEVEPSRTTFSAFSESNPTGEDHEAIAKKLVSEHFHTHKLHRLNAATLHRMADDDEPKKFITYTTSITIELVVFLTLFTFCAYVLNLISQTDLVSLQNGWAGFFPYCQVAVTKRSGPGVLVYQCVSMGLYAFSLLLCELYYIGEYVAQCMRSVVHPDEAKAIEMHTQKQGLKHVVWTGPVFMSRIHLTKVRTIQNLRDYLFGPSVSVTGSSGMDTWAPMHAERNIHDIRAEQQLRASQVGRTSRQVAKKEPVKKEAAKKDFVL